MSAVLLAAVADALWDHRHEGARSTARGLELLCCGTWYPEKGHAAHQAERVMARLTELLPGLPAEDVAALIGGTVERKESRINATWHYRRAYGPWVPDSPPAAEGGE